MSTYLAVNHAAPHDVHQDDHKAHTFLLCVQQPAAVTGTSTYFSSRPLLGERSVLLSALSLKMWSELSSIIRVWQLANNDWSVECMVWSSAYSPDLLAVWGPVSTVNWLPNTQPIHYAPMNVRHHLAHMLASIGGCHWLLSPSGLHVHIALKVQW